KVSGISQATNLRYFLFLMTKSLQQPTQELIGIHLVDVIHIRQDDQPVFTARHRHVEQPRHGQPIFLFVEGPHGVVPAPAVRFLAAHHRIEDDDLFFTALEGMNGSHFYLAVAVIIERTANIIHGTAEGYDNANFFHIHMIVKYQPLQHFNQHHAVHLIDGTKSAPFILLAQPGTVLLAVNQIDGSVLDRLLADNLLFLLFINRSRFQTSLIKNGT